MSDIAKTQEAPLVAEPPKAVEEVPAVSEPTLDADTALPSSHDEPIAPAEQTADAETDDKKAEEAKEEKPEPKEITHGTLSKTHGGLLSFFKTKRFFYFQDEPISEDNLKKYLNKDNASRSQAAYASQTGKGLLLYSKAEDQKSVPHGIIQLAQVKEVIPTGATKFILKLVSGDLHFESPAAERDNWVFTLNHKITEAKASSDAVTESEGYKAYLEKLTKPTPVAAGKAPEKEGEAKEDKPEDATEDKAEKKEAGDSGSDEEEEAGPSDKKEIKRTPSKKGKRTSYFGFLGKKEKADEKKDEQKAEDKIVETPEATTSDVPPVIAPIETEANAVEEVKPSEEEDKSGIPATTPKATKRNSFFGGLFKKDEASGEAKEGSEAVAPVIETTDAEGAEVKATDIPAGSPAAEKTPASSPPKTKSLLNIFDKKDKAGKNVAHQDSEPSAETPADSGIPTISTDSAVADETTPESATAATSPKDQKRKSSFFSFKKDKKAEEVKSDTEDAEPAKTPSTSPIPKGFPGLGGLIRKASKSAKSTGKEPEHKEVATPATVTEESAPESSAVPTTAEAVPSIPEPTETIGDVVPEAVNAGAPRSVQASA